MKPSYDEQRKNAPATDRKFRENDEHLLARDKEDVALSPHGDKLHTPDNQGTTLSDKSRKQTP